MACNLEVGAVVADIPENSNFNFDMMVSYETLRSHQDVFGYDLENGEVPGSNFQAYVLLDPNTDLALIQNQLDDFSKKHFEGQGNFSEDTSHAANE
jgi:putative ABC transport system permease protein